MSKRHLKLLRDRSIQNTATLWGRRIKALRRPSPIATIPGDGWWSLCPSPRLPHLPKTVFSYFPISTCFV